MLASVWTVLPLLKFRVFLIESFLGKRSQLLFQMLNLHFRVDFHIFDQLSLHLDKVLIDGGLHLDLDVLYALFMLKLYDFL